MIETEERYQYWKSELIHLEELRDNAVKIQSGLDYATELLTTLRDKLQEIDMSPDELKVLSEEKRNRVLRARRRIVQALCDEVVVHADGHVVIMGVLDGSEAAQFELTRW